MAPLSDPHKEHCGEEEDRVDDRRRGWIEVVIAGGDELADFVDEEAHPCPDRDGGDVVHPATSPHQGQQSANEQQATAPQRVCDVQVAPADLRVAGERQEPACTDDAHREADEHDEERPFSG